MTVMSPTRQLLPHSPGQNGKVTADAILARDGTANLAWVLKLTYEDGHYYQLAGE